MKKAKVKENLRGMTVNTVILIAFCASYAFDYYSKGNGWAALGYVIVGMIFVTDLKGHSDVYEFLDKQEFYDDP